MILSQFLGPGENPLWAMLLGCVFLGWALLEIRSGRAFMSGEHSLEEDPVFFSIAVGFKIVLGIVFLLGPLF